jgi:hypothetical protein
MPLQLVQALPAKITTWTHRHTLASSVPKQDRSNYQDKVRAAGNQSQSFKRKAERNGGLLHTRKHQLSEHIHIVLWHTGGRTRKLPNALT